MFQDDDREGDVRIPPLSPEDVDVARLQGMLRELPQSSVIDEATRDGWLTRTLAIDPTRAEWHIRRAGGFGGSEAGLLLEWATRNDPSPVVGTGWGSAGRLVRQKLLMLPPDPPGTDALRGIALEPVIMGMFEDMLSREGRAVRRREDVKALIESDGHPRMPWMRASLDGLYEIDGKLWIVDFKAPSETSMLRHREHPSMGYVAQLNHYALVAQGHGVTIDHLALVMFDYRNFGVEPLAVMEVASSEELRRRIAEGGRSLWHEHVLRGLVPEPRAKAEPPAELIALLREAREVREALAELMERKEEVNGRVAALMTAAGLEKASVEVDGKKASVTLRASLDAERAWERLSRLGGDGTDREELRDRVFALGFADVEQAADWVARLRREISALTPEMRAALPAALREHLEAVPEVTHGKPLANPLRQALRAAGEDPRDFETPFAMVKI